MLTKPANDQTNHKNDDQSYVGAYTPPSNSATTNDNKQPMPGQQDNSNFSKPAQQVAQSAQQNPAPVIPGMQTQGDNMPANDQPVSTSAPKAAVEPANSSEAIEDQNIFTLLGVDDGTDKEKEEFLDELQEVIWEDFLETDLDLLVTEEEHKKVKEMLAQSNKSAEQIQDEIVSYLEELIPDLEEIMMEKALELKEDMVRERIAGMKEFHAGNQQALDTIDQAEKELMEDKWASAAKLLNSLVA